MSSEEDSRPASPFDTYSHDYDEVLNAGLRPSGETAAYFAAARIRFLAGCLRKLGEAPARVLDYGCGRGSATPLFLDILGASGVTGIEQSRGLLAVARQERQSDRTRFFLRDEYRADGSMDLAFCNGVFHHVPPAEREAEMRFLAGTLKPGGLLALWDNNPWNPGARYVMRRIPFDRDAVPLSAGSARALVRRHGLRVLRTDHLFLFPRALKILRVLEPPLSRLPLGAQYQVLSRRDPPA